MLNAKLVSALLLLVSASPSKASDWWFVGWGGTRPELAAYFADAESLSMDGNLRRIWVTNVYERASRYGMKSQKILHEFDCGGRKSRFLELRSFYADSRPMPLFQTDTSWSYLPPDSVGSLLMKFACEAKRGDAYRIAPRLPLDVADEVIRKFDHR